MIPVAIWYEYHTLVFAVCACLRLAIYSCAENELKMFICNNNGNTRGYCLVKAYI